MSAHLIAIAGVPPREDVAGKLIGFGCPCAGVGADPVTEEQAASLRWVGITLIGIAALGFWWMESRRHA